MGPEQGDQFLQDRLPQAKPGQGRAAERTGLLDRLNHAASRRRQRDASDDAARMGDATAKLPAQLTPGGGSEALSQRGSRGDVDWKHAIAAAVSPALLTPRKDRDVPPNKRLQAHEGMDSRDRATHGAVADEGMDSRDRATHGAVAEKSEPASEQLSSVKPRAEAGASIVPRRSAEGLTATAPPAEKEDATVRTAELIESLRPNSKGDEVKELQERLGLEQQGTYGPKTLAAVKKYVVGDEFSRINAELKTRIDFNSILEYEGLSLEGYVPDIPDGQSGVTIGVGFDVGQFSKAEIKAFGFPEVLTKKLLPYAGLKLADATAKLEETGGLKVTVQEVRDITFAVKKKFARDVAAKYDEARIESVPKFANLTPAQQTVVFSRFFHQGRSFTKKKNAAAWWSGVTTGKWADVQSSLRDYPFAIEDWYKARVSKEADLLGDISAEVEKK
ncbi:pesticin C-terminus-like muramidase [Solimonas sp. K1W22B-7]|uniref:pesticin C-terminus-like muramidase n=1 Tax=Solimonas sp. K1W22B-7 TaxID=2303331 RepID=UPI0013C41C5F|nr:pesticin C-terminus-like muramidase [Solimonas sp. K1W22B-7]